MSKFKNTLLYIISGIGTLLGILLAAKAVNKRRINPEIAKNNAQVKKLQSQINEVKAEKEKLNTELVELEKTADGRSKEVKKAKKVAKKNDQTIADLEAALAEAEKNLN